MPSINKHPYIKELIFKWPERFRRASLKQKQVAKELNISEGHLSQIVNMKIECPRQSTINKVEMFLKSMGV